MSIRYLHIMTNVFNCSYMPKVATYSLSHTRFIWLNSRLGLNFDLVLGSPSENCPQLTAQSLLSVKSVLFELCSHFQSSKWLFVQHYVYLQMFQLCKLRDKFWRKGNDEYDTVCKNPFSRLVNRLYSRAHKKRWVLLNTKIFSKEIQTWIIS